LIAALQQLDSTYAWTPSGQGFLLRIAQDEQVLGLIVVDRFTFPEFRERYLNLALAIIGVFALVIEYTRTRKRLVEAEKLASLGVLVAGVAHEINTPLGISLMAATTMQEQLRRLAQRFTERSMTQADLLSYLETNQSESELIHRNLDRISQLVDAFRQVALEGKPMTKYRFRLKNCLDDIIASLGKEFSKECIDLQVNCDRELEIESYPGDWSSILTNLINNSLYHGFKGRNHGHINIAITTHDGILKTDYTDDGVGVSTENLARIFDPFFTTDLQKGSGLGLYLVYNIITNRLGGRIKCTSQFGNGVHFQIETPL
jgi:signal transduction histidine kinase